MKMNKTKKCKHCNGLIDIRNPSSECDHLFWPDMLTEDAKLANGYRPVIERRIVWKLKSESEINPMEHEQSK